MEPPRADTPLDRDRIPRRDSLIGMVTMDLDLPPQPLRLCENRPVDEFANCLTHGLGFALSVLAALWLLSQIVPDHRTTLFAACSVYCGTLIGLYAASMLSHAFVDPRRRRLFRTLDQACIFLLIAGSFTPFGVTVYSRGWWPLLFLAMWVLALLGFGLVLWMRELTPAARVAYGVLGWLPVISLPMLMHTLPPEMLGWIIAGGMSYSLGTLFLVFDQRVRYFHALWHTLVIAGSTCHYIAILLLVSIA